MEFEGRIDFVGEVQQISEKFAKREIWTTTGGDYPQSINFQLVNDKCDLIDAFNLGDKVKVFFNLRGRKWTNPTTNEEKCFNTLDAWKIELIESAFVGNNAAGAESIPPSLQLDEEEKDDLPL